MAGRRRLMFAKNFTPNYFKFTALQSGTFTLTIGSGVTVANLSYIEYSTDDGETWIKTNNVDSTTITITTPTIAYGNSVLWRGSGLKMTRTSSKYSFFSSTGQCNVSGNISTLLNIGGMSDVANTYGYGMLFTSMQKLVDASDLILPQETNDNIFYSMFGGCTSLVAAPKLPTNSTASSNCYYNMFYNCTNITTAPNLPAITLGSNCYYGMFGNCTKLNYVKALFTTTPSSSYTNNWLYGVASTGIFVKNINATWNVSGASGVPSGWTIIYFDPDTEKYYLDDKITECDDHGNPL